jgi:large subunit ribosomal protein L25
MSKAITLKAKLRDVTGKKMRIQKKTEGLPAVSYGHGIEAKNLWVNELAFSKVYAKAGESALVELEVAGKKINALIHEIQNDSMSGRPTHIDFFEVNMKEEVETEIPVEFIGESAAVKAHGGVLIRNIDEIAVKCLPSDLPEKFEVDLAKLATFDDVITVKDLKVSDKVEIMLDSETVIALVAAPRTEAEMESLDQKVEEDVTKVAGVVKEEAPAGEIKEKK